MVGDPGPGQRPGWGGTLSRGSERIPIGILKSMDFFFFKLFIYLFIYGCVGSSFLREGFLQLRQAGATPHRGAWASQ